MVYTEGQLSVFAEIRRINNLLLSITKVLPTVAQVGRCASRRIGLQKAQALMRQL